MHIHNIHYIYIYVCICICVWAYVCVYNVCVYDYQIISFVCKASVAMGQNLAAMAPRQNKSRTVRRLAKSPLLPPKAMN